MYKRQDLPWLLDAFGDVESVTVQKDTISDLGLPYPDCVTPVSYTHLSR